MARKLSLTVIGLACLCSVSACVSADGGGASPESLSERWIGKSADAFFDQYGSPFAEYGERSGGVRYTWRKRFAVSSSVAGEPSEVRVCEIDLLTDANNRIQSIGATRNSKIRGDEAASCDGAFARDVG